MNCVTRDKGIMGFVLIVAICNLHLLLGRDPTSLIFDTARVADGQCWRIVTHPFVHVSWYHLLLDSAGGHFAYGGDDPELERAVERLELHPSGPLWGRGRAVVAGPARAASSDGWNWEIQVYADRPLDLWASESGPRGTTAPGPSSILPSIARSSASSVSSSWRASSTCRADVIFDSINRICRS